MHSLTVDRILPPLQCHFIDCDPIWMQETQRLIARREIQHPPGSSPGRAEILWRSSHSHPQLVDDIPEHSFVAIQTLPNQFESNDCKRLLELIHRLTGKNVACVVVGEQDLRLFSLVFKVAGAVDVVTDILRCDRLGEVICKAASQKPTVITDWRTRFTNRLPWNPLAPEAD